jgi:photosystem II stability/assembly factor-like uncharacterized protein
VAFGIVLATFVTSTVIAFRQAPHPDPRWWAPSTFFSRSWWLRPAERNPFLRLQGIPAELLGVYFVDGQRGWTVGAGGAIFVTQDGGENWRAQSSGTTARLNSVWFVDGQRGWAVGINGTVLATQDGGGSWKSQRSGTLEHLNAVDFVDGQRGWAVGSDRSGGTILATQDGGRTWKTQRGGASVYLTSVHFFDGQRGWIVGTTGGGDGGRILATQDGGESWKEQNSGTVGRLDSVHFVDRRRGWAVGENGTILVTADGGESWNLQAKGRGISPSLLSVHFVDAQRGWAVDGAGAIIATQDGGGSWKTQYGDSGLSSVYFVDAQRGWAVGDGEVMATRDGGQSWKVLSIRTSGLSAVCFAGARRGWAVGDDGTILATEDEGRNWRLQSSGTKADLRSVYFLDEQRGWAAGSDGTILWTRDGGGTWFLQNSGSQAGIWSMHFVNGGTASPPERGWAVGNAGEILATQNSGENWLEQGIVPIPGALMSVYFVDEQRGWAVGLGGMIVATRDGGLNWRYQREGRSANLWSVQFLDGQSGWAVGLRGTILVTRDGGASWTAQNSGTEAGLYSVHFVDRQRGWVVGDGGTILTTQSAGDSWRAQNSATGANLRSVRFVDGQRGWAVGDSGTILATQDGGEKWSLMSYHVWPAPWYWAVLLALCVVAIAAARMQIVQRDPDFVDGRPFPDSPLGENDFDALNLREVAQGISRFFRNPATVPPFTMAVVADWGVGKTSLMRLVEADLRRYGVRPVWFNAWHHRTEEHLLAYLLEAVREQAVPPFWTPGGVRFRLDLLKIRGPRYWFVLLASAALLAAVSGLLLTLQPEQIGRLLSVAKESRGYLDQAKVVGKIFESVASLLAALLGLFGLSRPIKAFGSSPSVLLNTGESASARELQAKTSLRMDFAREFREVAEALVPNRMVIFVDDLDRCRPEQTVQVLEGVSFLVSSGKCFVVFGMATKLVEASVGLAFQDIAEEIATLDAAPATADEEKVRDRKARANFAHDYLRKLINLKVSVRRPNPEEAGKLLVGGEPPRKTYAERLFAGARRWAFLLLVAVLVGAGVLAFEYGQRIGPQVNAGLEALSAPKQVEPAPPVETKKPDTTDDKRGKKPDESKIREEADRTAPSATFVRPGAPPDIRNWWLWVFAIVSLPLLAAGTVILMRRPQTEVQDSQPFKEALEIWSSSIAHEYATPRELKRFTNFLRYVAMRWRSDPPEQALLERGVNWIGWKLFGGAPPRSSQMPAAVNKEAAVVYMATHMAIESALKPDGPKGLRSEWASAIIDHVKRFGEPTDEDWKKYREICGEIDHP